MIKYTIVSENIFVILLLMIFIMKQSIKMVHFLSHIFTAECGSSDKRSSMIHLNIKQKKTYSAHVLAEMLKNRII